MKISRDSPIHSAENALDISCDPMVAILSDSFTVVYEDGRPDRAASVRLTDNYLSFRLLKPNRDQDPPGEQLDNSSLTQVAIKDIKFVHAWYREIK